MSQSPQQNSPHERENVLNISSSEAHRILTELRILRRSVMDAWQERAVILTPQEQRILRDEIKQTCELLTDLTSNS